MDHKLRVLIRLDVEDASATIAVTGCVTMDSYGALLPVVHRTRSLAGGIGIDIDLRGATHLELPAVDALRQITSRQYQLPGSLRVGVISPHSPVMCPTQTHQFSTDLQVAS